MAAHRALLADNQTGKGHALTLMLLASFLWSTEPVEGTRSDWADILGISAQTFEAHVPQLGRAGCLSYIQSHCGYYVFYGLTQDDQEAAAIRAAWVQAETEFEGSGVSRKQRYVWITQRVEALKFTQKDALKFTLPVVVTTTTSCSSVIGEGGKDALKIIQSPEKSTQLAEASRNALDEASKLTLDQGFAAVVLLYEQEIGGTLTAMMLDEFNELWTQCADLERWRYAFKASIGKRNRWAYVKAIIEHPERDTRGEKGNGRDADNGRGRAGARGKVAGNGRGDGANVAGSISHDLDDWFGEAV
jgi:hypothetical protein